MKFLFKVVKVILVMIAVLFATYLLGPQVASPNLKGTLPNITADLVQLNTEIEKREASNEAIRADNEARIIWYDSIPKRRNIALFIYMVGPPAKKRVTLSI